MRENMSDYANQKQTEKQKQEFRRIMKKSWLSLERIKKKR